MSFEFVPENRATQTRGKVTFSSLGKPSPSYQENIEACDYPKWRQVIPQDAIGKSPIDPTFNWALLKTFGETQSHASV